LQGDNDVARAGTLVAAAAGVIGFAFLAGFVVFASGVARDAPRPVARADGIVVLTGGRHRLAEAERLLEEGQGRRLLISGANRVTSREDLRRKSGLPGDLFECCVDIGYEAHDTIGNAEETRDWATARQFAKLIIVTSSYHMPRSLSELGRVMPNIALIPYPVVTPDLRPESWWWHAATARVLFTEYVKYLPAAARFEAARLMRSWDSQALADNARTHSFYTHSF
jgi:uncharacterized SAM-binding protein YcdF (DUF218 family)